MHEHILLYNTHKKSLLCLMGYIVGRTIAANKENSSHVPRPSFGL